MSVGKEILLFAKVFLSLEDSRPRCSFYPNIFQLVRKVGYRFLRAGIVPDNSPADRLAHLPTPDHSRLALVGDP